MTSKPAARLISFHYTLKDEEGELLDTSREGQPMSFIEGKQQIIPGLESELVPLKAGDKKLVIVTPEKGYGEYIDELILDLPVTQFPEGQEVEVGDQFRLDFPNHGKRIATVTDIQEGIVELDGNHPLAGQALHFDIEIMEMRPATEADLKAQEHDHSGCDHDHGDGGHKH